MSQSPLVSIGMPVYNGEMFLRRALESLLNQEYKNLEIIISDNDSNDSTATICKEYAKQDHRIRYIKQEKNIGLQNNFKFVLNESSGKYFMWAAVDDFWMPAFIQSLVAELENDANAGLAMSRVERVDVNGVYQDSIGFAGRDDPCRKGHLTMTLGLATTKKYNLFIYGLYRTNIIKKAITLLPSISSSDRWFLMQISMAARFKYVDKVEHLRTQHKTEYQDRYPTDEFSENKIHSLKKIFDFKPVPVVAGVIIKSSIIPSYRKLWLPVILVFLAYRRFVLGIGVMLREDRVIILHDSFSIKEKLIYHTALILRFLVRKLGTKRIQDRWLA